VGKLSSVALLRRIALPVLRRLGRDISIRHAWTGDRLRLHSYRHKGYWFHRRRREAQSMELCRRVILPGQVVFDAGGHIGFTGLFFAHLVGPSGHVHVFEPGTNNLPYARENLSTKANVTLVEKGVGCSPGTLPLHLEDLTGQNNSFLSDFHVLRENEARHFTEVDTRSVEVEVITLDDYALAVGADPNFIKIDVEGFELQALGGAKSLLRRARPVLMLEIQADHEEVFSLLRECGYRARTPSLEPIDEDERELLFTFCFHEDHASLLDALRSAES